MSLIKRIFLTFFGGIVALVFLTSSAFSFDVSSMNEGERTKFGEEIRTYLMQNPEVLIEALRELEKKEGLRQVADDRQLISRNAEEIFNDQNSVVRGNENGDITIVEFVDYRCGYCRKAHDVLQELLRKDDGIRLVLKEFPVLGAGSVLSSKFALATKIKFGEQAYQTMHDALITLRSEASPDRLIALADELGFDGQTISQFSNSQEVLSILAANGRLGDELAITGTPAFVIMDSMVRGYLPLEQLELLIAAKRENL